MTQSFRHRGGSVRIAAWHGRADVASLALRGRGALAPATVDRLLDRVRAAGYREVVTNALAPAATLPLVDAGFAVRERLRVLVHDLQHLPDASGRTRRARRRDRALLLATDRAAFDDFWELDDDGLRQAARATPSSQLRIGPSRAPTGYALFGRAGNDGYVQRLAVHPEAQGDGLGRALARRRPAVAATTRRRARLRQHAIRQRPRVRPLLCFGLHTDADRSLRPRARPVTAIPVTAMLAVIGSRVSRFRRAGAALVLAILCGSVAPLVAPASPGHAQTDEPEFALLSQNAWVAEGGDVSLRLDIPASFLPAGEDVQLRLRAHTPVSTTEAFDDTIDGDRLGNRIDTLTLPVSGLPRDAQSAVNLTFGLRGSLTEPNLDIGGPGVYPLELALRTDETLASFVTWIVVADPATAANEFDPVRLANVWNVSSAPALAPDGTPAPGVVAELAPEGRLADIATLLEEAAATPLSLRVGPETLEAWASLAQADARLAPGVARVRGRDPALHESAARGAVRADRRDVARGGRARRRAPGAAARRRDGARSGRRRVSGSAH